MVNPPAIISDASNPAEPDAALALRAAAGDRAAFGVLLARHGPGLVRLCQRLVGDAALAEDCAQDASLLALLRLQRLRSPEHFGAWLRGIGIRVCRRALQRGAQHLWVAQPNQLTTNDQDALHATEAAVDQTVAGSELAYSLRCAVQELPRGQREAVRLFYLDGLTYEEAATVLGIATSALKIRLHKARVALRHRFRLNDDLPAQNRQNRMNAQRKVGRRTLAIHEAAHAVLHWEHGGSISRITIAPVSGVHVQERASDSGPPAGPQRGPSMPPRDVLQMLMAGEAATFLLSGRRSGGLDTSDRDAAAALARSLTGGDDVETALVVDQAWVTARDRLTIYRTWSLVERVAVALQERQSLDGDEFRSVVSR
ncbi:MAG: RNA polymerase sigma factor [Chloroflexi bacterium]|nr:RNA polymerase sigma factor [Chloroflexota bacterium]